MATFGDIDEPELDADSYSGTFRWKSTKKLLSLPPFQQETHIDLSKGWKGYLASRGGEELVRLALQDLSSVDCLSFVNSILYLLVHKNILHIDGIDSINSRSKPLHDKIHIICLGCSQKAEERVLLETNCFLELLYVLGPLFRQVELWLIGPEISATAIAMECHDLPFRGKISSTMTCNLFCGTAMEFFRANPQLMQSATHPALVVGYNCGFGNFENPLPRRFDLFYSWYYDLLFLTSLQALPMVFFCANDYADLVGEVSIMHSLFGMKFICPPGENPFSFASTMIPPHGSQETGEYSRGNSFFYAVQGCDKLRRKKLPHPAVTERGSDATKQLVLRTVIPLLQSQSFEEIQRSIGSGIVNGHITLQAFKQQSDPTEMIDANEGTNPSETISEPNVELKLDSLNVGKEDNYSYSIGPDTVEKSVSPFSSFAFQSIFHIAQSTDKDGSLSLSISLSDDALQADLRAFEIDLHHSGRYIQLTNKVRRGEEQCAVQHQFDLPIMLHTKPTVSAKYSKKANTLIVKISR